MIAAGARRIAWRSTAEEGALDFVAWTESDGRWRWRIERARDGRGPGECVPRERASAPSERSGPCQTGRSGGNVRLE